MTRQQVDLAAIKHRPRFIEQPKKKDALTARRIVNTLKSYVEWQEV